MTLQAAGTDRDIVQTGAPYEAPQLVELGLVSEKTLTDCPPSVVCSSATGILGF
jgi:hypothetical protein